MCALTFSLALGRRKRRQHRVARSHLEGIELQRERRQRQAKVAQFPGARVFAVIHASPIRYSVRQTPPDGTGEGRCFQPAESGVVLVAPAEAGVRSVG
jgi:hypothetical protein